MEIIYAPNIVRRGYFEADTEWTSEYSTKENNNVLLTAYDKIVVRAEKSAMYAVKFQSEELMADALWYEAVAQTLEQVLSVIPSKAQSVGEDFFEGSDFEIPLPPKKKLNSINSIK